MATFVAGQPYTGKVIDPSQGGAIVDYKPSTGNTSQALQQQQSGVQLTSPVITPSRLITKSPYVPATTQDSPIPDLSHLAPVNPADNPANQQSQLTPSESRIKSQIDELMGVNQGLEGKAKDTALYNEQFGVNAASDAITGLNSQLTGLINESKAIPLAIQQNAQVGGANVTKGGLAPIQTAQLRNNAIQSLAVSSQIDAMNGQLSNAIKKVDRAIAYKYADLEARSATLTKNLEILKNDPSLTLEQQDRVDKKLAAQKAYDAQLAQQKKTETDTHDAILKTLSNNSGNPKLTSQVVAALQAAKTPEEVLALENYFGLSSLSKSDQLDQTLKQAQIDKTQYDLVHPKAETQITKLDNGETVLINTQTGAIVKNYGGSKSTDGGSGNTTVLLNGTPTSVNNDALSYAQQYASTGKLPSPAELKLSGLNVAQVTEIAKGLPKQNGAIIDNNTGVKSSSLSPAQEDAITAMNEIVTQTMPALKDRFGKINTGVLGGIGGMIWTSQDRQDYDTFRQEFLSKLLVARSGAAVTEQEYNRYAAMLPSNFNQAFFLGSDGSKKLNALDTSMKTNLDNKLNALQVSVAGYSDVKKQLEQLSPEQKAELEKENLIPAWAK